MELAGPGLSIASNIVVGSNPPFTPADFLNFYPTFGGTPLIAALTVTQGSAVVTGAPPPGILPGMVVCPFIPLNNTFQPGFFPDGTVIQAVDSGSITMSFPASADGGQVAIYNAPFVPLVVLYAYINLASASLVSARWKSSWQLGMLYFIAHFCTLWLRTQGQTPISAAQLATQGLARGITISKSAGGVSQGIQPSSSGSGLEGWAHWNETEYGVLFAGNARMIGAGPLWAL